MVRHPSLRCRGLRAYQLSRQAKLHSCHSRLELDDTCGAGGSTAVTTACFRASKPGAGQPLRSTIRWSDHGMTKIDIKKPDPEETQSGAARVLTFFRDRLLSGELKAGDRLLPELELAAALEVSRPVLREALRSLAMLGLLDIQ